MCSLPHMTGLQISDNPKLFQPLVESDIYLARGGHNINQACGRPKHCPPAYCGLARCMRSTNSQPGRCILSKKCLNCQPVAPQKSEYHKGGVCVCAWAWV